MLNSSSGKYYPRYPYREDITSVSIRFIAFPRTEFKGETGRLLSISLKLFSKNPIFL